MSDYEYSFDPNALDNTAASVYRLARSGGPRVLDLGSGPGIVAAYLTEHDDKVVTCVDHSVDALTAAKTRGVGRTIEADLASSDWVGQLADERFDVVIVADVLEHLVDPAALLGLVNESGLLADGGFLVVSVPNAGHEAVLAELIRGRFTYQDTGLLDSTHLRFFTLASVRELLERSGYFINQIERTRRTAEQTSLAVHDVALPTDLRDRLLEESSEAQTYQFIVRAEPAGAAREIALLRERLERVSAALAERDRVEAREASSALTEERDYAVAEVADLSNALAEARQRLAMLESQVAELSEALDRQRRLTADERKIREQVLAGSDSAADRKRLEAADRKVAALEKKLDDVYQSRTWKVGRAAWTAFHVPSRLLKRKDAPSAPAAEPTSGASAPVPATEYALTENTLMREKYEQAISKRFFTGDGLKVVMAVFTEDLDDGRGDLYTAVGLGRCLVDLGHEVIYRGQDRWYDLPEGTDVFVAMLETVDLTRLPAGLRTVAWVRNQTEAWVRNPSLALFDLVLASSPQSVDAVRSAYPGRVGLLPIGVDTDLFKASTRPEDRHGVVSTVNQWGREREVFGYLKERPADFPLALYGHQRGIADQLKEYAQGPTSFFSLPSLYEQARVVLDDFNHTTAGFGNVNSRLFEAVACGAVVLTNRATGLDELELSDVPVFSSARELFDLITHGLTQPDALKTAADLQERVVGMHSYKVRAATFIDQLEQLDSPADGGVVISHYPDYIDNPYTEMMWSDLRTRQGVAVPVDNRLNFTAAIRAAAHRPTVFHLNWTAPILGGATDEHDRLVRQLRFLEAIDEMHSHGIPSIWTVHNAMPHECADKELEAQLRQEIADRVDVVHVMCDETVAACTEWYQLPASKVRVIPHPSYIDVYPNLVDRDTARHELGLTSDDFVYLHFGQIRPYKGIDGLLDAFEQVSLSDRNAKLLLVGKPGRFDGIRQISDRARAHPNVIANLNPVPDADVQLYMNAADVAVLPHRAAMNSGALLLAYSFACPVIAPAIGCMEGLVDAVTGVVFDPDGGTHALQQAMLAARHLTDDHGRAAHARAAELHYLDIGKRFSAVVDELLG